MEELVIQEFNNNYKQTCNFTNFRLFVLQMVINVKIYRKPNHTLLKWASERSIHKQNKKLTNVRACEPEPFYASLEPLLQATVFFSLIFPLFFSISFHFLSFLYYDSLWLLSRKHLKMKIWKILNKQTIAWKVLLNNPGGFLHQRRQQQFSASEDFRYTGSMIRVEKRPTRNIHIATQSSDCS